MKTYQESVKKATFAKVTTLLSVSRLESDPQVLSKQEGCVCKSLKADKSRWVSNRTKLSISVDRSYKEEQFMYETFFRTLLTFRDDKHRNVGDVTKICLDGLRWTLNFGENVLHHCKETYFRHQTYRICTRY